MVMVVMMIPYYALRTMVVFLGYFSVGHQGISGLGHLIVDISS
jgi:hypothetical protein